MTVGLPGGTQTTRAFADIPAFDRPTKRAPASVISPAARAAGVQQNAARQISTAFGAGYVLPSTDGTVICLSIPDPVEGFGGTCAKTDEVRVRGLVGTLSSPQGSNVPSEVVIVLPEGAAAPSVELADGRTELLKVVDGVAVGTFNTDAVITVTAANGSSKRYEVFGREPEGNEYRDCGNERYVLVPKDYVGDSTPLCKRP